MNDTGFSSKERDKFAIPGKNITADQPLSVATGRDLGTISTEADKVLALHGEQGNGRNAANKSRSTKRSSSPGKAGAAAITAKLNKLLDRTAAKPAKMPASQKVKLAALAAEPPRTSDWLYEIKFDGYRMLCCLDEAKVRFISRNGNDWTEKFPKIASAARELPVKQAMLDGEVVALDDEGVSQFQALQNAFDARRTHELVYYAFDIIHLNGRDLKHVRLEQRKEILHALLAEFPRTSIRFSEHLQGSGSDIMTQACRMRLEGVIAKRRESLYRPGRNSDWLKIKCGQRAEFVIGGFTAPRGRRQDFGAILVGYYDAKGHFVYAGRVGTGFDNDALAQLHEKFTRLVVEKTPFVVNAEAVGPRRGVHWLAPKLVAEVAFGNWTDDGLLRHPSFQGLREDKEAQDVRREQAVSPSEVQEEPSPARGRSTSELGGIVLTHADKVLYPEDGITKRDLADYYAAVAKWMLPHVAGRPLALLRCPNGHDKSCFFQKHPDKGTSKHLHQVNVSLGDTPEYNLVVKDTAGLFSLVQMGVLEIHAWGCLADKIEMPDRLVFDLDPDPAMPWPEVIAAAREIRELLEELGFKSFLKTTGGKGLHIVMPVRPRLAWEEAKAFCRAVVDLIVRVPRSATSAR